MKNLKCICLFMFILPLLGFSQSIDNLDYVSPFHNGYAAIKKDKQWAFINTKGKIAIDFRTDLVTTKIGEANYPIFSDNRCLIKTQKKGIWYFGYIDTSGKTIINPQFLNATNFKKGKAIALELVKEVAGRNDALGKNIVYYKHFEVTIDKNGTVLDYLTTKGKIVTLDKTFLTKPPKITSKQISENVFAIKEKKGKWTIINTNK